MVRTRFAAEAAGGLHFGNAHTAVLNWLFARQNHGVFIIRVDDAATPVGGEDIEALADLRWLGVDWDEGPSARSDDWAGPNAPYLKSERGHLYREHAAWLLAAGVAYRCFCAPTSQQAGRSPGAERAADRCSAGNCRGLGDAGALQRAASGQRFAIRFDSKVALSSAAARFDDATHGRTDVAEHDVEDFMLLGHDGQATRAFADVVDDALMEITHVIRNAGHREATPQQALLFATLGHGAPTYIHVPDVLDQRGETLSETRGGPTVRDCRRAGYHPEAVLNYLALLACSSPEGEDVLSRGRLLERLSIDHLRTRSARFDPATLQRLSAEHIGRMELPALVETLKPWIQPGLGPNDGGELDAAVDAVRSRLSTFADINEHLESDAPRS